MNTKQFCVYIMTSGYRGTLYVGVTSNLPGRVYQHREGLADGFTNDHGINTLVWFEPHETAESAIRREKRLKRYKRDWKIQMTEDTNPH